jgi:serine/threonine protein kinase
VNRVIWQIIQRCWSQDPKNRPSFDQIYDLLEEASFAFFDDVSLASLASTIDLEEAPRYLKVSADQGKDEAQKKYNECISEMKELPGIPDIVDYERVKDLGKGRFGIVRLVEHKVNGKKFAVKYIEVGPDFDSTRLFREVGILASLKHPFIINIVGWCLPNDECKKARIIMEYACNGSLSDVLNEVKKGNVPKFWTHENISKIIVGIVLGMKHLHSKDIIHRDLKPGNLLIDEQFRIRICDFGTSRIENCGTTSTDTFATLIYAAPEIIDGEHPTKKVDVFAFGLILYRLFVGKSVFPLDAAPARIVKLHIDNFRPEIPNDVNRVIRRIIERCWSKDAENRPSFHEIFGLLEDSSFALFDDVSPSVVRDFISEVERN